MPIKEHKQTSTTGYWQYGNRKKYYYKTLEGRLNAYYKMMKQVRAIYASGYREK